MVLRAVRGLSDLLERCATAGEETKKSVGRKPTKREFVSPPPPAPPHCTTGIGESTAMKTVGLLSGGKDSVFNLLHCIVNHHEPIALASLGPGEGKDEIDSYMYQTVGHSGLHAIAVALQLPLFTHTISGTPLNLSGEYGSREGSTSRNQGQKGKDKGTARDETEDLYELLLKVKTAMPEIEAVSCGAILSNYQRVRVEHVCARLGLTPIAYLWERNQEELLDEMVQAGMESVLVKVAGAGLGVEHLGKPLKEMQPTLLRLNERYQLHVCGEGGEYETFTLDCPLFRKRVVLDDAVTVISNADPYSTVAHLRLDKCSLLDKPDCPLDESWEDLRDRICDLVAVPPLLDAESKDVLEVVSDRYRPSTTDSPSLESLSLGMDTPTTLPPSVCSQDGWIAFGEVSSGKGTESLEEEVRACFTELEALLATRSATLLSISHLTIYLSQSSMIHFPVINAIYVKYFGSAPPTRACVAILMPEDGHRMKLEGIARSDDLAPRKALHVQSISYWAAANIGPYSQGITVGSRLFIAGQIPLVPASLTLPGPFSYATEVTLSLQHVRRVVIAAQEARWTGWCELTIGWIASVVEEEWNQRLAGAIAGYRATESLSDAPVLFVSAAVLPKQASIEWQVLYQTGQSDTPAEQIDDDDDEDEVVESSPMRSRHTEKTFECASTTSEMSTAGFYAFQSADIASDRLTEFGEVYSIRAFHKSTVPLNEVTTAAAKLFGSKAALTTIGVERIATITRHDWDVAFVVLGSLRE